MRTRLSRPRRLPTAPLAAALLMLGALTAQTPPRSRPGGEEPRKRPPTQEPAPSPPAKPTPKPNHQPDPEPTPEAAPKAEPKDAPKTAVEDELKSAFVLQFARYVEWPRAAAPERREPGDRAPLTIAVVGDANLGATMTTVLADKKIDARAIVVRNLGPFVKLTDRAALRQCQVLVFASDDVADWLAIREELGKAAVLTVSTMPAFSKLGGMIELYPDGKGLRFEVVQRPLTDAGLAASSKLLRLSQPRASTDAAGAKK